MHWEADGGVGSGNQLMSLSPRIPAWAASPPRVSRAPLWTLDLRGRGSSSFGAEGRAGTSLPGGRSASSPRNPTVCCRASPGVGGSIHAARGAAGVENALPRGRSTGVNAAATR